MQNQFRARLAWARLLFRIGLISIAQTPEQYNLKGGLHNLLVMVGGTFLVSGIISAMAYLKQSPLPELEEVDTNFIFKDQTKPNE